MFVGWVCSEVCHSRAAQSTANHTKTSPRGILCFQRQMGEDSRRFAATSQGFFFLVFFCGKGRVMKVQSCSDFLSLEPIQQLILGLESLLEPFTCTMEQKREATKMPVMIQLSSFYFYFISAVLENVCW